MKISSTIISSNGLKWTLYDKKTISYEDAERFFKDNKYILFQLNNYHSIYYDKYEYSLFEMNRSNNKIQGNFYLDNKYQCNLI